jgi:hypothetical protein
MTTLGAVIRWAARLVRRVRPAAVACAESLPPAASLHRPRRKRWTPDFSDDLTGGCPCAPCEWARANPMEERAPRRIPLAGEQLEQYRIHEAYLAAELAMWHAVVWLPEARAERMKALSLALRIVRAAVLAASRALAHVRAEGRYHGPPLASCLDHATAAPRTGPPAGRPVACPALGGALT